MPIATRDTKMSSFVFFFCLLLPFAPHFRSSVVAPDTPLQRQKPHERAARRDAGVAHRAPCTDRSRRTTPVRTQPAVGRPHHPHSLQLINVDRTPSAQAQKRHRRRALLNTRVVLGLLAVIVLLTLLAAAVVLLGVLVK